MKRAANISITLVVLFMLLSIGMGTHQYSVTRQQIVSNLNAALLTTVNRHAPQWLSTDTIRTYIKLQQKMGTPLTVRIANKDFAQAIVAAPLKKTAGMQLRLISSKVHIAEQPADGYIMSDTILWMPTTATNQTTANASMVSFQGYAYCPLSTILKLSDQTMPFIFLILAIGCALTAYFFRKHTPSLSDTTAINDVITYGNLSLCYNENCIYDNQRQRIKLTPLEYKLMEMFYRSAGHSLLKEDICSALWPGKDNASETLYALIRRLKKTIESHSNLRITTLRGRAYSLEEAISE
jgi:DNA-binding winged helix-turn-helix (wHTH) protein